jgi:protein-tyrosine phosphatase
MDQSNYKNVLNLAENEEHKNKVQIILNELYPNENVDVPDPYFGMTNGFEIVYTMLDEVCDIIADKLIAKLKFASTVISLE